ncbi:MAG: hypothetical protein JSW49_08265 [candidate division WOR-3 bacterium]|nr:MAG: hypothetical protein JSW49_08265 [candidate division WOR-3 bacterium]
MKSSKIKNLLPVLFIVLTFLSNCSRQIETYQDEKQRQKVEKTTPEYNATYFVDPESKHLALIFDIVDGELKLADGPAQLRPGRMPYYSTETTAGGFLVVFNDAAGEKIGQYTIEDPRFVRSCDFDYDSTNVVQPIRDGSIEILLPYDIKIATIVIGTVAEKPVPLDVSKQIRAVVKQ